MEEINLKEKYKNAKGYYDMSCEEINRAIFEFNKKLKNGERCDKAYTWLAEQRHKIENDFAERRGFRMDFSFNFLYPEIFGPMPDTYEEWENWKKDDSEYMKHVADWVKETFKDVIDENKSV